ncbi:MAG: lamin tail domain-containing protein, partial [Candidatus Omnitrophica bacterium]|nr:lamin tail domain-containing protein [Candidatus Omnitrophota bacterium]
LRRIRQKLVNPDRTRVIDAVQFDGQASGVSMGRYPDGAPAFHELSSVTPNAHNSPLLIRDVVINEIMYHPISENSDDEYIELYNQGTNAVDLGLWKLTGGIQFTFAAGTVIPARGYKILARNATRLFAQYPNLNPGNTVGDFKGALSNRGEHLTLSMPDRSANPSATNDTTADYPYIVVDEVSFGTGGRWGRWSDGGGSSLELIDARADHRLACNWADSDESSKSTNWTTIECTGTLDLGNSSYAADSLHILLLGEGECLIDNVEVRAGTAGPNLVANSTFESGVSGWYFQGNHSLSSLETGAGYNSSRSLHIRSTGEGDSGGNRIRTRLTTSLGVGSTATLRARVRWLRGFPEIVLRLHGNWLEASGAMPLPSNLGTPGAPNSRAVANAGPAIYDVTHSPVLPAAKEPVVVTARVDDPDGLDYVQLHYRLDPNTGYTTVNMTDDGTGGDAVAGDEVYSATVPGQAANALIAFYIQAADKASSPVTSQFPSDAPTRECLVRFGDPQPAGSLGTYRLWITQASLNQWKNREGLSNLPIDATFVPGNQRVIYNAGAVYTGSPYKTRGFDSPIGSWCDYIFHFPRDDQFLGATDLKICYPGNLNDDDTTQREQTAYWIAEQIGIYHNHRRYVNLYVIGVKRGIVMEDTQIPNADVIDECYPNEADGDLFKAALWFEFSDSNPGDFVPTPATLQNFMSGGVKKLARYRWNWPKHAVKASANNYDNLFALVDALNGSTSTYVDQVQSLVDVDQWMRNFAVEHIVGNWDSYGYRNGANMFAYKTPSGRWQMLIWDIDVSLRSDYGTGPTSDLFEVGDPTIDRMYKTPAFRRIYFQALSDAANGPLLNANVDPLLDAKYNALRENGISVVSPASIKSWIRSRRAYILGQLLNVAANFTVNGSALIVTNRDTIALTGSAPIEVKTITVNDIIAPVTWNTVTGWSLPLHLEEGTNVFTLIGYNQANQWVPGASNVVTVVYTNTENPTLNAVVINEWLAANTATLPDPAHGTYSPWFELYNPTTAAVDISGWYLTSFLSQPRQWQIPTGTTIPSRGFLLVWADAQTGLNGIDSDLHANFTLDRIGGAIGLAAPNGQWVDTVVFGNQTNDVSQGRYPDGTANPARFMTIPTPGSTNTLALANPPLSFYR